MFGLENLAGFGSMLRQAQQMRGKMQQVSEELKQRRAEGSSGGGMVSVEVNGLGEVLSCRIDPSLVTAGDRELIEDLLPAAVNQALANSKQLHAEALQSIAAGMNVPDLGSIMAQLTGGEGEKPTA